MKPILFSQLRAMTEDARVRVLDQMVEATRGEPNGELISVSARIGAIEARLGVDAETVRSELSAGRRAETLEVCELLILLDRRSRLASVAARAD